MTIKNVKFREKDRIDTVLSSIGEQKIPKSWLSPISTQILNESLMGNISIVFSQGPLNLTPLICALLQEFHEKKTQDILVGIPRNQFIKRNKEYCKKFYSLYSNKGFFYDNILYCSADVKNYKTTKLKLDTIKLRPKYGKSNFKDSYEQNLIQDLDEGICANWPKIISVPIDYTLPDNLLENKEFYFENSSYILEPFTPGFVILESINERLISLNAVKYVVNQLEKNKLGGIIHFSWPYLPGLKNFLDEISLSEIVSIFHFGKRYGIEMREKFTSYLLKLDNNSKKAQITTIEDFIKKHPGFKYLSLEGENWNGYYPEPVKFSELDNIEVFVPKGTGFLPQDLVNAHNHMDTILLWIRQELKEIKLPPKYHSLMAFPPFIDSFLRPRDIMVSIPLESGTYRSYSIKDALNIYLKKGTPGLDIFLDLCSQLDNVADFPHLLTGIQTYPFIDKNTALFSYIYRQLYTLNGDEDREVHLMICDYTSQLGSRRKIINRIKKMLQFIKLNIHENALPKLKTNFFEKISLTSHKIQSSPIDNYIKLVNLDFEIIRSKYKININLTLLKDIENHVEKIKKNLQISFIDFRALISKLPEDIDKSFLLLPGPIPILSFRNDSPIITKGFDLLLRPFKKIIFFSYAGGDAKKLTEQAKLIDDLMSFDSQSEIAIKDLSLSINSMPDKLIVGLDGKPTFKPPKITNDLIIPDDTPFDTIFRDSMAHKFEAGDTEEIAHLSDIWNTLITPVATQLYVEKNISEYGYDYEQIRLNVIFKNTDRIDDIFLNPRSYVRVVSGGGDSYCLANELEVGQEIIYLETDDKESLDNYFIKSFSDYADWSLEEVLEVYTCLSKFIYAVQNIHSDSNFQKNDFKGLDWLDLEQKEELFKTIRYLLSTDESSGNKEAKIVKWQEIFNSNKNPWSNLSSLNIDNILKLKIECESGLDYLSYTNMYKISQLFGMKITENSFKSLLSSVHSKRIHFNPSSKAIHYFFRDPKNLEAIGTFIGNKNIELNYEEINEAGVHIWKILELIGHSISRVKEGRDNPYNEMDQIIKEKMRICKIMSIKNK